MSQLKHVATAMAAAAAMLAVGHGISAADDPTGVSAQRATIVPMSPILRKCDFSDDTHVPASSTASVVSIISSTRSNVTANVQMIRGTPGIRYFVRLVETPPPTALCRPGNPGVAAGTIDTDGGGNGSVTLDEAILTGATGAWVFVEGPPGDFYSSDFLAKI